VRVRFNCMDKAERWRLSRCDHPAAFSGGTMGAENNYRAGGVVRTKQPSPVRREREQPDTSFAASRVVGYAVARRTILLLPSDPGCAGRRRAVAALWRAAKAGGSAEASGRGPGLRRADAASSAQAG
jgi:hypothetical protein